MSKLEELENSLRDPAQINIMQRIDNVIFSHGGLTTEFVKWLDEDLLDADIDDVISAVNDASQDYLWNDESPLWIRPQNKTRKTLFFGQHALLAATSLDTGCSQEQCDSI